MDKTLIWDNNSRGNVGEFLKSKIKENSKLSIVSAYFTIYAYDKLKDKLNNIEHLNFLFGEPKFVRYMDPDKTNPKSFNIIDNELELSKKLEQKFIAKECSDWIKNKVDIKSIKNSDLLHGKMYYIENGPVTDALLGSSNFTVKGLGLNENKCNLELNVEINDKRDVKELNEWFNEIWNNDELVEDVKTKVLEYLEQIYSETSPELVYFKTLYHIFYEYLKDDDTKSKIDEKVKVIDSMVWNKLYDFQKDGARGAINKLLKYNGCILADSVGLGKTFTALAVIKYFELLNYRVLVLCPKKLMENWTVYLSINNSKKNPFLNDRFNYTVLAHTDLNREQGSSNGIDLSLINWNNYDLVILDESHNFRNNSNRINDDEKERKSRYYRLLDDVIKSGVKTKALLLSATPVNNQMKDLRNQISLFTGEDYSIFNETLQIKDYSEVFKVAQTDFSRWAVKQNRAVNDLLNSLPSSFFKLLDAITIARSRNHIKKYYDISKIGNFPQRNKPVSIYPNIDTNELFTSYDSINDTISKYKLSLFNPSFYLKKEFSTIYKSKQFAMFDQGVRESHLIGMMKINFMKRLESSISSFTVSLERTIDKINSLIGKIENYTNYIETNSEYGVDLTIDDEENDELNELQNEEFTVGKKIKYKFEHLDLGEWLIDLKKDRQELYLIYQSAKEITANRDAKLLELKEIIKQKVSNPTINNTGKPNRKVLIFTAFSDTAQYLYENLVRFIHDELNFHTAIVTGNKNLNKATLGTNNFLDILTNFSPISKERNNGTDEEIEILFATDCISEGQNLQDCDMVINYDIHWNPVRIIQRFGRIDRLGSINPIISMINFWPTKELDKYINLKNRVEARMAMVDLTATNEENLLNTEEIKDSITNELNYRDKQLKKLKDEIIDLEDDDFNVNLSDFSLDDFRIELVKFIENNKKVLENTPDGLYAIVPKALEYNNIVPGVIFCLKQLNNSSNTDKVNPIHPYYLVYLQDDGELRYTFTGTKNILEIFKLLCSGKTEAFEDLCKIFNDETKHGSEMKKYNELLSKALKIIYNTFSKRVAKSLTLDFNSVIPTIETQPNKANDFELITWLIIK